jgi:hypothetical protein
MAIGKEAGAFTLKATSHSFTPGPGNGVTLSVNFEGSQTGELSGEVLGTLTTVLEPGVQSGTWTWCGWGALTGGENLMSQGQGTLESIGTHKWRFHGTNRFSDGSTLAVEAEGDLAARSLSGKLFELA